MCDGGWVGVILQRRQQPTPSKMQSNKLQSSKLQSSKLQRSKLQNSKLQSNKLQSSHAPFFFRSEHMDIQSVLGDWG